MARMPPDVYMLDQNRSFTFYDIASALSRRHSKAWTIVPTEDFVYDQRMQDDRVPMPPLDERLPELRAGAAIR